AAAGLVRGSHSLGEHRERIGQLVALGEAGILLTDIVARPVGKDLHPARAALDALEEGAAERVWFGWREREMIEAQHQHPARLDARQTRSVAEREPLVARRAHVAQQGDSGCRMRAAVALHELGSVRRRLAVVWPAHVRMCIDETGQRE